jgi:hypothetical protein
MPFRHHLAEHFITENLIVKITTQQNTFRFGEGIPRDFVTGEKLSESIA